MISSQENPLNIQQNQLPPQSQVDYPPSQNIIPPPPGYSTSQGVINPIPQAIPQNNYYPQNGVIGIQNPRAYKEQYKNYTNINKINHKGIYQTDEKTFYISNGCCFKLFPYIFFFVGFILIYFFFIRQDRLQKLQRKRNRQGHHKPRKADKDSNKDRRRKRPRSSEEQTGSLQDH